MSNNLDNTENFETLYLKIRKLENRVYTSEQVAKLPYLKGTTAHSKEWKLRAKSAKRFGEYLAKNSFKSLLEIGCGNGWFSNYCSTFVDFTVGTDVNTTELNQAISVFKKANLTFIEADIFEETDFEESFDVVVFNASIQYFPGFDLLIQRVKRFLKPNGEIHIIDSPFYEKEVLEEAKKRTISYYQKMNVPEMSELYFHHLLDDVADFDQLHVPHQTKLNRLLKGKDSPFCWYRKTLD